MIQGCYFIPLEILIRNGEPQKGAIHLLKTLEQENLPYLILSEQSSRFRDQISYYLVDHGFHYAHSKRIYTSTMAAIDFMQSSFPNQKKVAMLGGDGMKVTLQNAGYELTFQQPDFLLVGMNKGYSYEDYCKGLQAIKDGAKLISTDNRRTLQLDSQICIGNGAIVKMLEYASQTNAISFGYGSKGYLTMACRSIKTGPNDVLFVSDNFKRDIVSSIQFEMNTAYITRGRDISQIGLTYDLHPDFIINDLSGLTK